MRRKGWNEWEKFLDQDDDRDFSSVLGLLAFKLGRLGLVLGQSRYEHESRARENINEACGHLARARALMSRANRAWRRSLSSETTTDRRKRLSSWKRFLAEDRDFDYAYVLECLVFKLERVLELMPEVEAEAVGEVALRLRRVHEENYFENMLEETGFNDKYGELEMLVASDGVVAFVFSKDTPRNRGSAFRRWHGLRKKADEMLVQDLKRGLCVLKENAWDWSRCSSAERHAGHKAEAMREMEKAFAIMEEKMREWWE